MELGDGDCTDADEQDFAAVEPDDELKTGYFEEGVEVVQADREQVVADCAAGAQLH